MKGLSELVFPKVPETISVHQEMKRSPNTDEALIWYSEHIGTFFSGRMLHLFPAVTLKATVPVTNANFIYTELKGCS